MTDQSKQNSPSQGSQKKEDQGQHSQQQQGDNSKQGNRPPPTREEASKGGQHSHSGGSESGKR